MMAVSIVLDWLFIGISSNDLFPLENFTLFECDRSFTLSIKVTNAPIHQYIPV
jgi:hypothetical protein